MSRVLVSAIVPLYNGRAHVAEAVESMLAQSVVPDEILIVDDGSTDSGADLVRGLPRVRLVGQEHSGQGAALNRGVASSTGAFLVFLDADDRWLPEKTEAQLRAFAADPQLHLVFGQARQFVDLTNGSSAPRSVRLGEARRVLPSRLPSAMMIRRPALERVGPFPVDRRLGALIGWVARADESGLVVGSVDRVVYERRIHLRNAGIERAGERADYAHVLKDIIDRRRRMGAPNA